MVMRHVITTQNEDFQQESQGATVWNKMILAGDGGFVYIP
jgi:hypothetical protein